MNSPAVDRKVLRILAGLVWSAVGLGLCLAAARWLTADPRHAALPSLLGIGVGFLVYRFGFARLARRNRQRIYAQSPGKHKVCLFAFQNWRSYIIAVVMMVLGYTLRHLPVSKMSIAPIYLAIGLGLLLSSLIYYAPGNNR
jgi:hypothetical protein